MGPPPAGDGCGPCPCSGFLRLPRPVGTDGRRVYVMPPFLRGTPAVGPDGRSLPAVRGGQRGAGCDRRSASCRARQPSASTLPRRARWRLAAPRKRKRPARSLGRGVRRLHEPRPEQGERAGAHSGWQTRMTAGSFCAEEGPRDAIIWIRLAAKRVTSGQPRPETTKRIHTLWHVSS